MFNSTLQIFSYSLCCRIKARQSEGEVMKELNGRWLNGHDLCTVSACNVAFEDCREGDGYDLGTPVLASRVLPLLSFATDAVWQLVGLSHWVIEFLERLMKACLLFAGQKKEADDPKMDETPDDLFGSAPGNGFDFSVA